MRASIPRAATPWQTVTPPACRRPLRRRMGRLRQNFYSRLPKLRIERGSRSIEVTYGLTPLDVDRAGPRGTARPGPQLLAYRKPPASVALLHLRRGPLPDQGVPPACPTHLVIARLRCNGLCVICPRPAATIAPEHAHLGHIGGWHQTPCCPTSAKRRSVKFESPHDVVEASTGIAMDPLRRSAICRLVELHREEQIIVCINNNLWYTIEHFYQYPVNGREQRGCVEETRQVCEVAPAGSCSSMFRTPAAPGLQRPNRRQRHESTLSPRNAPPSTHSPFSWHR